jgi:hypothetical protein
MPQSAAVAKKFKLFSSFGGYYKTLRFWRRRLASFTFVLAIGGGG